MQQSQSIHPDKLEIQKQWDTDPCGAYTVDDVPTETLEYYRAIRKHRYDEYAPWMGEAMAFSRWQDKDVLEIGTGVGSDHFRLASQGNRMTALDLSREHLRHTSRHLELEGLRTAAIYGDAEGMQLEDESFDLVYSFGVLHHTPDIARALSEVKRVLRPQGTAIIGLYHRNSAFFWLRTIAERGIVRGRLFTQGYRRLMSEIEVRTDPDSAIPIVNVYSRREVRRLFRNFASVSISAHHIEWPHLGIPRGLYHVVGRGTLERFARGLGWYLIVHAHKE
ncbi:MAG: class I SAM-dependent methyltransferase [Gammaproteobacteria bacterium]